MPNDKPAGRRPITSREIDLNLHALAILCADPASPVQTPVGGWTFAELAEIIGCSETSLRKTAERALIKIRHHHPELKSELTTRES